MPISSEETAVTLCMLGVKISHTNSLTKLNCPFKNFAKAKLNS